MRINQNLCLELQPGGRSGLVPMDGKAGAAAVAGPRAAALSSPKVRLVPYRAHHVARYHAWMEDEWLREMTASERLTLEEEHQMCRSWRTDEDKLTFIVLDRSTPAAVASACGAQEGAGCTQQCAAGEGTYAMVGDVNLFFNSWLLEEGEPAHRAAEVEVMIAEPCARRKGLAAEALWLLLAYSVEALGVERFVAKIKIENAASISLFTTKLGLCRQSPHELHVILNSKVAYLIHRLNVIFSS
eukprot:SAG11_NODE_3608_length_2343_cov_1.882799_2_plen_243_part_00